MPLARHLLPLAVLLAASTGPVRADDLPKALAGDIVAVERSACEQATAYDPGFVVRRDVDGDGRSDVLLDYSQAYCGARHEPYCERGRCLLVVYRSVGSGWKKVFDDRVGEWRIDGAGPATRLFVDGRPLER
jgi:hypothetical protein